MEDKPAPDPLPMVSLERPPRGALTTLGLFLLGNGEAIRRLAATRHLWLVGLVFTVSAGLAREYDAEDLLTEPWHLLIAPGASLVAATALWLLVQFSGLRRWAWSPVESVTSTTDPWPVPLDPPPAKAPRTPRLLDSYLAFLGLFWLTAPLAWFYGIPYERMMSAGEAASANLWTLQLVALWRVVLMIRVLTVLYDVRPVVATIIVLLFGDVLMLIALAYVPVPIFAIMGGVRLGEAERVFAGAVFAGKILGTLGAFVLGVAWLASFVDRKRWSWNIATTPVRLAPLMYLAITAITWWCLWLPTTQPEQQFRRRIERAMVAGDLVTGIALLEKHYPADLPPHWNPPPRLDGRSTNPDPMVVLLHLTTHPSSESIHHLYEDKLLDGRLYSHQWDRARILELLTLLEHQRDASRLIHGVDRREGVQFLLEHHAEVETDNAVRERIQAILHRYHK